MMKHIKLSLLLLVAALLYTPISSAQDAYAVQDLSAGVNVTHSKEWYDQFEYNWPINTTTNRSKITDKASDPDQIIALLRYIYMEKQIPGIHYAAYGTNNNNKNTRARQVYYGGIAGGWDIPGTSDIYTDYQTYKPDAEGYTVLLVAVRDNFTQSSVTAQSFYDMSYANLRSIIEMGVEYVQLLTDGMRLNENLHGIAGYFPGTLFTLENASGLNRFFFLSKGQARDQFHASHGDAEITGPFGRMFEQFSPTDGTEGSEITNYYETLKTGVSYPIQHDCNSVLLAEHYFSMVGKNATGAGTHQDVSGLQFYIPDQRLTYFDKTESVRYVESTTRDGQYNYFNVSSHNVTHDGRTMNYTENFAYFKGYSPYYNGYEATYSSDGWSIGGWFNSTTYNYRYRRNSTQQDFVNGVWHYGNYAEYAYYNLENFSPKTQWYRIEMTATPVQETNDEKWGEHTYRIDLAWHSSVDSISYDPLDQIYWVYEIINGEEVLISPEEGIINVHQWTVSDYEDLYTEQYPNGRKRTFVVKGRPDIATYAPVRSNAADAIIPGYDKRERLSLSIGSDYYSKWNAQGEYNQYCNAILVTNGTGNTVSKSYISSQTEFNMFRMYKDENNDEQTIKFATVSFGNWSGNGQNATIAYTVNYLEGSQQGSVTGKTAVTSGTFGILPHDDPDVLDVDFGNFEVLDIFQASTAENAHPNGYTYTVTFESAVDFEIDDLDENNHLQYVADPDGDFWYNPDTQQYEKIVEGEVYDQRYKVKTITTRSVRSNDELIPVFKSNYSLHNQGYTQEQIDNDNDNNMSNLLTPHLSYDGNGNATTDLNKITVNLQSNPTSEIYQYEIYRNPQLTGNNNNVMIARAQAGSDTYKVWQNDQSNTSQEIGNKPIGDYTFEDEAIMVLGAQSVAYAPVILTRPKDEARLQAGDYNTYGADIQHVGIPKMKLGAIAQELSTYTWMNLDDEVCGYCEVLIGATATMPDEDKYTPHYWRSWRELADASIAREEYQGLLRNMDGGFMYEQTTPGLNTTITSGSVSIDYGELNSIYGEPRPVNGISSGTFGVLRDVKHNINMNFKIRMYYLVNNPANRAPRRANGETTSETGNYYVMEYNYPYEFDTSVVTGVEGVAADRQVVDVTYVNTVGIPSQQPWSGVNIVVTRYNDGTTSTAKVVR